MAFYVRLKSGQDKGQVIKQLSNFQESGVSSDIWSVYYSLPDITDYFEIFDDYLDFHIFPWDNHGFDKGEMYIERKIALRLLTMAMKMQENDVLEDNLLPMISGHAPKRVRNIAERAAAAKRKSKKGGGQSNSKTSNKQVPEGFNAAMRQGFEAHDMVETTKTIDRGINPATGNRRFHDETTRSVLFDVPGEDSIGKDFDWKRYATPEDIARYEAKLKADRKAKREARKSKKT